ncbi:bifunctional alpha/beta hydrolase/class I SAM-dependent methyltransferase [Variovorax sp. KK3]|uniref:bifunctional alpha/beta hydrolase/class I SAM-dependent methyltransferase n=1 Tax=Variovorax sp. KK3 TaxID=1855728 RepID=UPI00097C4EEE|nr:bifunctional alpha/beta hydrolase/class I SAM-dependent methyltransferase [Variovorax sp. KK3]
MTQTRDARQPRTAGERHFQTHDGVSLFYRHWPAAEGTRRGAIVLFHRGHEHGARMAHLVDELNLPDFDFFAWDARGHGRSPGQRGYSPGFATSVRDVQTFVEHIGSAHGVAPQDIHVVAQSVGAVLVATWAHDYAPRVRGLTLASPAFKVKLYVPFARPGLALMHKLRGLFFVNSYVKPKFLTHDPARIASYQSDPLITRPIAVNILLGLYEAADRVVADAQAITLPTQLLISGADWVVHHKPQHDFFERLGSTIKRKLELPGFFHDTLGEKDRGPAVQAIRDFVLELFAQPPQPVDLRGADRSGATADESRALAEPLSPWSPRGAYWAITRAGLRFGGLVSQGVKLGHQTGFDSGSTLDYVYRNEARGAGPVGRLVDRNYLDAIGWRGIRQRKLHVEELLRKAMELLAEQHREVRVMDIAAGHGRYVLDAVQASPVKASSILLRDYSDINVRDGRALIAQKELQDSAQFVQADAFDRLSLASVQPRPTLAVVSGLYELFPDNEMVSRSLAGVGDAVEDRGYLVYTGQPWHPQLEMIARALTSHRQGQAWVMRRRTQAEMDQLVEAAGFRKIDQRVDEWGIFTVSLAVRTGP